MGKNKKKQVNRVFLPYKNGNVEKEGTAYERNNWEITGEWKYYDEQGKLKRIEIFDKNDLLETKEFN